ncbi:hypothetical protein GmHk_18G052664 [Glycine max]|nr:hypothetical protein GmHk_18G052664 [Glycine max]
MTYKTWKEVPAAQKDLIWEDIQIVGERWRQFKSDLTRKWALAANKDSVDDIVCEKYDISKEKWAQFCQTHRDLSWEAIQKQNTAPHLLSRGGYEYLEQKLMAEKTKKKLEEAAQSGSIEGMIDPSSPIRQHMKCKMAHTKKTGQMTFEATKEIADKIDLLTAAIGRPEHPGRVRATGAGVTIKQYFGSAPQTSHSSSSMAPEELEQLTQKIKDQLEESITEKGLALPLEHEISPSVARVSTKGSCVDPSAADPDMGDSDKCGLYIEENPSHLVTLGRVYEGSTAVHNIPLLHGQVKVGVEEVKDAEALVPIPIDEVKLMGQTLNTFLAWLTHHVKHLSKQPLQVMWDATVFEVFNEDFPLYIKHKDLSEIAHSGQCLSLSVIQLWILHLTETSMRAGNSDVYGFLEPQSIQRSGQLQFELESYMKSGMQSSKRDVYLGAYLNGVIDKKEALSAAIVTP